MVETNQESVGSQLKKKKVTSKKNAGKPGEGDKPLVKKLPVKKDGKSAKTAGSAGAGKGQTVANMKKFLKGAWNELKKVHWPNRREILAFTSVVLVAVGIVAVLIFAIDGLLSRLLGLVLR